MLINRPHDQKDVRKQTRGINPIRQCCYIITARLTHQPACLPGIKRVAQQDRQCCPRQDLAGDQFWRETTYNRPQYRDEHEVEQIIDEQTKKSVKIATDKPGSIHHCSLRMGVVFWHGSRKLEQALDAFGLASLVNRQYGLAADHASFSGNRHTYR